MNRNSLIMLLIPTLLITLFSVSEFTGAEKTAVNADPQNHVLRVLLSPENQSELALSSNVQQELTALHSRRIALFNELHAKDSITQREIAHQEFQLQTNQLALSLLNVSQRAVVNQIQLRQIGLQSLLRPEIRVTLVLSDSQLQRIQALSQQRMQLSQGANATEQSQLFAMVERRIYATLNDNQRQSWLRLIGTDEVPVALLQDEEPEETTPTDEEPEETTATDEDPAETTPAEPTAAEPSADSSAKPPAEPASTEPSEEPADEGKPEEGTEPENEPPTDSAPPKDEPDPTAKPTVNNKSETMLNAEGEIEIRFAFTFTPWKDVITWFAELNELSLQMDGPPPGTLNYSDPRFYTPTQAMDLMNGMLLTRGYTLVRRNQLLTVVNLENPVPEVLVQYVPVSELDGRGEYELVKTLFQLVKMTPEEATSDLQKLIGPQGKLFVFPAAKQVLVQETAGRLRTIRDVIEGVEKPRTELAGKVVEIQLEFAPAEDILAVARTMLSMGEEDFSTEGLNFAVDTLGTRIFATGEQEKLDMLQDLVKRLDVDPLAGVEGTEPLEQPQLQTHPISVADPDTTFQVLQTMLAGLPDIRLALDPTTNKVIAFARPAEQARIQATIRELEGDVPVFEVISLKTLDTEMALVMIANMFGTQVAEGEPAPTTGPKVTADPVTMKLFIRATESELALIRSMIDRLESENTTPQEGNIRILPYTGDRAIEAVERAERFWQGSNRIRIVTPETRSESTIEQRETNPKPESTTPPQDTPAETNIRAQTMKKTANSLPPELTQFVTAQLEQQDAPQTPATNAFPGLSADEIRVEVTSEGIILYSNDLRALDAFEAIVRRLTPPNSMASDRQITIFYLKYSKVDVAKSLLQQIMSGGEDDSLGLGSLVSDATTSMMGGGLMGMLLGGGGMMGGETEGSSFSASGTVSIVANQRLNALIVQANDEDLQMIDDLLKVIDREGSETEIETAGKPRLIPLTYTDATEISAVLKEVYAGRITGASSGGQQQRGGQEDMMRQMMQRMAGGGRGGSGGGGGNSEVKGEPAKMTIGVDASSNSLIIAAPEPMFLEVHELVMALDQAGTQTQDSIEVRTLHLANPDVVNTALRAILGENVTAGGSSGGSSGGASSRSTSTAPSAANIDAIRERMEMFNRMRSGGGFGGGSTGGRPGGSSTGGRPGGGSTGGRPGGGSTGGRPGGGSGGQPR
jgi:type II secretory pathway component GspD/PulD (secretin)/outer membrane biosynthesis protein TonB